MWRRPRAARQPGRPVLADESGVCVLDPGATAVAKEALAIQAAEVGILARLKAGKTLDGIDTESGMDRPTS